MHSTIGNEQAAGESVHQVLLHVLCSYVMGLFIQKQHFPLCKPQNNHHYVVCIPLLSKEQCTLQPNL